MEFREATDRLTGPSMVEIAAEMEKQGAGKASWLRQARVDPGSSSYRPPPEGWKQVLATLARERAEKLLSLAKELEESS